MTMSNDEASLASVASTDRSLSSTGDRKNRRKNKAPRKRERRNKHPSSALPLSKNPSSKASIATLVLLVGLGVTCFNVWYITSYLERTVPSSTATTETTTAKSTPTTPSEESAAGSTVEKDDGKERILNLLREAGVSLDELDEETRNSIPSWAQVKKLYGAEPIFVGLDTCDRFQASGDPADHFVGVAGTFNTGTNLLAELLIHNCQNLKRMEKYGSINQGVRWQVPWGKHTPVYNETYRLTHKSHKDENIEATAIFPGVTIRDPAAWLHSMCRHEYAMNWPHKLHCPNLVPDERDVAQEPELEGASAVKVKIKYSDVSFEHESMIHHWNEWYKAYLNAEFPRLLVRFEDIIFHPKEVTKTVCECSGSQLMDGPFQYIVDSAKKGAVHGKQKTGYVDAIIKYGTDRGDRWKDMTDADLAFLREHLDPNLMELFHYHYPQDDNV